MYRYMCNHGGGEKKKKYCTTKGDTKHFKQTDIVILNKAAFTNQCIFYLH